MKRTYILKPPPSVQGPLSPAEERTWVRLIELREDRSPWGRAEQQLLVSSLSPVLASRISEYQFRFAVQAPRLRGRQEPLLLRHRRIREMRVSFPQSSRHWRPPFPSRARD